MKKTTLLLLVLFLLLTANCLLPTVKCFSQNLVPNPSFEDTLSCPTNQGQINYASGWDNYGDSPDYFNPCTFVLDYSVPSNWGGYQQPANGSAYSAFGAYVSHIYGVNLREFIGGQLISSLSSGTKYYVSFKVSLSISSQIQANCACNNIGAMFSTIPYSWMNPAPISNNPKIYSDSLITDTIGWTRIFGSFNADSAYQYIIIGNFFNDNNTDTLIMDGSNFCYLSYYYLDDVCVSTDSLFTANYTTNMNETNVQSGFYIYPNPATDYINIQCPDLNNSFQITIYNSLGQELYSKENIKDKNFHIDIKSFDASLLFITVRTQNKFLNYKLFKL